MVDEQRTNADEDAVLGLVERVIDAGSNYRVDEFPELYSPDLRLVMIPPDGPVATFDYDANVAFFRDRAGRGDPPLSTAREVRHVKVTGDQGLVVLDRFAAFTGETRRIVFTLWTERLPEGWRVAREVAVVV